MSEQNISIDFLRRLLADEDDLQAEERLAEIHPSTLAPLLSDLRAEEIERLVDRLFVQHRAAAMLADLPPELMPKILGAVPDQRLADVLARLEVDDMLSITEQLPADRQEIVKERLPARQRRELMHAELYPAESAGRTMTTHFIALHEEMSAQEAIDEIRIASESDEYALHLYVVDKARQLLGEVPIRKLVSTPPQTPVSTLMVPDPISISSEADQEQAAQLVARYDLLALPVVDPDDRMVGIITVDDVIDVINEEATEDIYHLVGLSESDRVFTAARVSISRRLPWMLVNLFTAFTAASVVGLFESTLDQLVSLAIFLPVVAGMGGNGGIQTLTVITRSIALGEIEFSSGLRAVGKELWVGLVIGTVAGVLSGFIAYLWQGNPVLGLVLLLAMMITMTVASLLGAAVPLVLKSLGQDPALGAGVLVTFCTDALGFFSFLGIATLLLNRLL
ncbi:MAG: magnesium transporter [Myxococcota bacterium]|nr:magnesium transporter [Myxococcota bacterium]